jgi:hypothetical protein
VPVARITGQGLAAIALSVGLLWGCVIADRLTMRRAWEERARVLRDIERLRTDRLQVPASVPLERPSHRTRDSAG